MAVTAAARKSGMDVGRAISGFYFHRLLCRVFSVPDSPFLLKGGQSILARTPTARATRDIDLLSQEADLSSALFELRELVSLDLEFFVRFESAGWRPIKVEDEYRSGLKVTFVPLLGARRLQPVSVDLVIDQISLRGARVVDACGQDRGRGGSRLRLSRLPNYELHRR